MKLTPAQLGKVLYELTKDTKIGSKAFQHAIEVFADMLHKNFALKRIDAIIQAYEVYAKKQAGIKELIITAARKLDAKEIEKIEQQFGDRVESTIVVDPAIIGGVIVKTGNIILNASISNQLEHLKHSL